MPKLKELLSKEGILDSVFLTEYNAPKLQVLLGDCFVGEVSDLNFLLQVSRPSYRPIDPNFAIKIDPSFAACQK